MKIIQEDLEILDEFIRKAADLISPISYHDDLSRLTPDLMKSDAEKKPGCYLKIQNADGSKLFPVCNRHGIKDPRIIAFSLKLAKRLGGAEPEERVSHVIMKLQSMEKKYSKEVPKTNKLASLKRQSTLRFNKNMRKF